MQRAIQVVALWAACLSLLTPAALSASCPLTSSIGSISQSSFDVTKDDASSTADKLCFKATNTRACDAKATKCCMGPITAPLTRVSRLTLTGANPACTLNTAARAKLLWTTVQGAALPRRRVPRYAGSDVSVPVSLAGTTTICVENTGTAAACDVGSLFSSSSAISYQLLTLRTTKKLDLVDKTTWTRGVACCLDGNVAAASGTCNTTGCPSTQVCTPTGACTDCPSGYTVKGNQCIDIDECVTGAAACPAGQSCINTNGSFACSAFKITLVNAGTDKSYDSVFQAAADHWAQIIIKDLPDFQNPSAQDLIVKIGNTTFPYTGPVDDVVIVYLMENIDGPRKVLGSAGPSMLRSSDGTPLSGRMRFDTSDIGTTISLAQFRSVVLHEMGHVLGIGTLWPRFGCVDACTAGSGASVSYLCPAAQREYKKIGCSGALPIETEMGQGSGCAHFREKTLINELMTPALNSGMATNPLSRVTIGAVEDIYGADAVSYAAADDFSCPSPRMAAEYRVPQEDYETILEFPVGTVEGS